MWESYNGGEAAPLLRVDEGAGSDQAEVAVRIIVMEGTCTDGTPSTPMTGEIVLEFL